VLIARPDMNSAMHFHTRDGVAVSALKEGLLPLSQNALNIWADVGYHDYEGVVSPGEEKARLQADLGSRNMMILRNHGTLALGRTIGEAFFRIYALEMACTMQVRTLSMGRELNLIDEDVITGMKSGMMPEIASGIAAQFWAGMMRKAHRDCPGFDR
ncbi:MAG: class II aldolase/adducin family protein, partial [Novosphingobium sp.]|nr:class II aldolase/adducin family protein [Novosphingobium sp.]